MQSEVLLMQAIGESNRMTLKFETNRLTLTVQQEQCVCSCSPLILFKQPSRFRYCDCDVPN